MAALPQYLISQNFEQPKPKIIPPPKSTQAVVLQVPNKRIKVHIRPREGRPSHILLGTINHADFKVIKAIPVHLDVRGGNVIASWRKVDEFGTGRSTTLACDDLGHTIAELYQSLKADEPRLGPDLARVWALLREYLLFQKRTVPQS